MPHILLLLIAFAALLGHGSAAVWGFNRLHALNWPCRRIKRCEKAILAFAAMMPFVAGWRLVAAGDVLQQPADWTVFDAVLIAYGMFSLAIGLTLSPAWIVRQLRRQETAPALLSNHTQSRFLERDLGVAPVHGRAMRFFARLPRNEILRLDIHEKRLLVDRLPAGLDGVRIAHLSDLHLTGRFTPDFCRYIVDRTNERRPDAVMITGDIVDKVHCIDWIGDTLGRLHAPDGVFFVLGNHDKRIPPAEVARLRRTLEQAGLVDLGGRALETTLSGQPILLAGNELPWFPAADVPASPAAARAAAGEGAFAGEPFRLLLSHSPDQIGWARARRFDLMLAGHTHGGQIRLPFVGPLIAPSRYGVKYASGLFHERPTLMHVSRGLCGVHPLRFNCPPELALLVLHHGARRDSTG